ncbi:circadian clock protein KaiA [Pleurocapsales cyanobacterium LEGE 10410]|nr:circadian clock protein KaiA [Pleurocapsales cyanobacterium LEGE 10410]
MSDRQDQFCSTKRYSLSKLYICLFSSYQQFSSSVTNLLSRDRYELQCLDFVGDIVDFVTTNKEQIDCIIFVKDPQINSVVKQLRKREILLPTVIVEVEHPKAFDEAKKSLENFSTNIGLANIIYHQAEIRLYPIQLGEINSYISLAISKFLSLTPDSYLSDRHKLKNELEGKNAKSLVTQQRRLTEKLKERLGYLGVYYKRNPNQFYRNLSPAEQHELMQKLNSSYCQILLEYFENSQINKLIDEFVDLAFFADISTSQILEMHMDLIDEFSYQLKIEGRSNDILLDYRLPLIDLISHLCEMYRRSIPREELSLELLFTVE